MFAKVACPIAVCFSTAIAAPVDDATAQSTAPEIKLTETIVCRSDEATGPLPYDVERACLPRLNGAAVRSGEVLRIALRNGTTKAFKDAPTSCEESKDPNACFLFRLRGYYLQNDAVVVERRVGGPTLFLLGAYMVERATGRVIDLPGEPHFSPDGFRFVSLSVCHDYCANRIDMWTVQDGAAKLEWRRRVKQGETTHRYEFEGWRGADHVQLRITPETEGQGDTGKDLVEADAVDAMLTRVGPGWVLDSPLSP